MIELKHITKIFHQKNRTVTALHDVSLKVAEGKIFGVIGASGAGKSTLIRCVNLLEKPTSGEVIVAGQSLVSLSKKQLAVARRQIGMIFQHFNLLSSRTVFENVALPLELDHKPNDVIKQKVSDLLTLVGLGEKHNDYPASLSGGQRQRVAIARTLANDPRVLLCDEATSSLDPATTASILNLLKDINQRLKITILLITHEMDVVKAICDEVAVISGGKLIEQGTVGAIFSHPKTGPAREFIASTSRVDIPADYRNKLSPSPAEGKKPLLKLEFSGQSAHDAVLSQAATFFGVENNIICAQMDYAGGVTFGEMLMEVSAAPGQGEKAMEFYEEKQIKAVILGYV